MILDHSTNQFDKNMDRLIKAGVIKGCDPGFTKIALL